MNKHIEIEYKILINKSIFLQLLDHYTQYIQNEYTQTNYYFTHPLFEDKHYMLRIREKMNTYELTLKKPYQNHVMEYNVMISHEEKERLCQNQPIHNEIMELLKEELDISQLKQQFSLTTHRYDIPLNEGILSLDYNTYCQQEDYELEFEVYNAQAGFQKFLEIIEPYHLQYTTSCESKVVRAKKAYQLLSTKA